MSKERHLLQGLLQRTCILEDMIREADESDSSDGSSDEEPEGKRALDAKLTEVMQMQVELVTISTQLDAALQRKTLLEHQSRMYTEKLEEVKNRKEKRGSALDAPTSNERPAAARQSIDSVARASLGSTGDRSTRVGTSVAEAAETSYDTMFTETPGMSVESTVLAEAPPQTGDTSDGSPQRGSESQAPGSAGRFSAWSTGQVQAVVADSEEAATLDWESSPTHRNSIRKVQEKAFIPDPPSVTLALPTVASETRQLVAPPPSERVVAPATKQEVRRSSSLHIPVRNSSISSQESTFQIVEQAAVRLQQAPAVAPLPQEAQCAWPQGALMHPAYNLVVPHVVQTEDGAIAHPPHTPGQNVMYVVQRCPSAPAIFPADQQKRYMAVAQDATHPPAYAVVQAQAPQPMLINRPQYPMVRSASVGPPCKQLHGSPDGMTSRRAAPISPVSTQPGSAPQVVPGHTISAPVSRQHVVRRARTSSPCRQHAPASLSLPAPKVSLSPPQRQQRGLVAGDNAVLGAPSLEAESPENVEQRTLAAREAAMALFDIIDQNNDGVITRQELQAAQMSGTMFDWLQTR